MKSWQIPQKSSTIIQPSLPILVGLIASAIKKIPQLFLPLFPVRPQQILALFICPLLICTAADTILLVVNTAAAFAPAGQTISPKSGLPDFFIPQRTPAAKKPLGPVIVLFTICKNPFYLLKFYNWLTKEKQCFSSASL